MRMSCNGCRVLRKGCSDACTIRPCLQWIKTPEAQANATVFLAKFYGRAGLLNLLAAAPADHLRPAVFRSLLYEACGRIVNPVYGSVGLLWSGLWQACQAAVEAVLKGDPVVQVDAASDAAAASPPLRAPGAAACYDIRHVAKDPDAAAAADLLRVARGGRTRFKRAASSSTSSKRHHKGIKCSSPCTPLRQQRQEPEEELEGHEPMVVDGRASSHDEESAGSHDHHLQAGSEDTDDVDAGSHVSQAEAEAEPVSSSQQVPAAADREQEEDVVGLELTLGFEPAAASARQQTKQARPTRCDLSAASTLIGLQLELPA